MRIESSSSSSSSSSIWPYGTSGSRQGSCLSHGIENTVVRLSGSAVTALRDAVRSPELSDTPRAPPNTFNTLNSGKDQIVAILKRYTKGTTALPLKSSPHKLTQRLSANFVPTHPCGANNPPTYLRINSSL